MITLSMLFSGTLIWEAYAGTWKQGIDGDVSAWWYDNGDGTFPISTWMWIDGNDDEMCIRDRVLSLPGSALWSKSTISPL